MPKNDFMHIFKAAAGSFAIEIFTKATKIVEKPKIIIIPKNGDASKFESKKTSDNVLK